MDREIDVQQISQQTLDSTNIIFAHNGYNIRVQALTEVDLRWCIAIQRDLPKTCRLPWAQNGAVLSDPDSFSFSFKIVDAEQRPAGACIFQYCPATENGLPFLNLEMIQNFHNQDSVLDGNTLRFALYVAVLFMADTGCGGLRLMFPVNAEVANYYIREYGFLDLTDGGKEILYRDANSLFEWFRRASRLVDDEQRLNDNAKKRAGGKHDK